MPLKLGSGGGTTFTNGGYQYHFFDSVSGQPFNVTAAGNVQILVVGGGGGGGCNNGGGGGGGALVNIADASSNRKLWKIILLYVVLVERDLHNQQFVEVMVQIQLPVESQQKVVVEVDQELRLGQAILMTLLGVLVVDNQEMIV